MSTKYFFFFRLLSYRGYFPIYSLLNHILCHTDLPRVVSAYIYTYINLLNTYINLLNTYLNLLNVFKPSLLALLFFFSLNTKKKENNVPIFLFLSHFLCFTDLLYVLCNYIYNFLALLFKIVDL